MYYIKTKPLKEELDKFCITSSLIHITNIKPREFFRYLVMIIFHIFVEINSFMPQV